MKITIQHHFKQSPRTVIIPITKGELYESLIPTVSEITTIEQGAIRSDFRADLKEIHTIYFQQEKATKQLILLGLGENVSTKQLISTFRSLMHQKKAILPETVGVHLLAAGIPLADWTEAILNGMALAQYDIGLYKTEKKKVDFFSNRKASLQLFVPKSAKKAVIQAAQRGQAIGATQLSIFDLVNAPSNKKTPQTLAKWAKKAGKQHDFQVNVLTKKKIEQLGLGGLIAVNRGSELPPAFIIMEYRPKNFKSAPKVGLVGKGVTFDTGGLSIKPSTNMHYMKSDMGGAAAVLGTMELTAKFNLPIHLIGIVPTTDNSVDALSIKPGDVIENYSGKTIEIIDTDAEGRLILADGLAYIIKHFKPTTLIDVATLTGSVIRAIGTEAGGLFTKNESLAKALTEAGNRTGERLWAFPMWDEYHEQMKSDIADIKNFSGRPVAGAITAAKFLEFFTEKHPRWAHLDIAGMALQDSEFSGQKSATAFGVRLLIDFLENMGQSK